GRAPLDHDPALARGEPGGALPGHLSAEPGGARAREPPAVDGGGRRRPAGRLAARRGPDLRSTSMILCLSGGTGGAKMVDGLAQAVGQAPLAEGVNTGDYTDFFRLRICPPLDICT